MTAASGEAGATAAARDVLAEAEALISRCGQDAVYQSTRAAALEAAAALDLGWDLADSTNVRHVI